MKVDKLIAYFFPLYVLFLSLFLSLIQSDAADDLLCVDLGGLRIIKKKIGAGDIGNSIHDK